MIPGAWPSATMPGDWNDFSTNKPLAVNQFGGPARFTTGGAGPWTKNYINFMGLPPGTMTVPNPLPFSTGFTIGIGAGTSVGTMRLEKVGTVTACCRSPAHRRSGLSPAGVQELRAREREAAVAGVGLWP